MNRRQNEKKKTLETLERPKSYRKSKSGFYLTWPMAKL